MGRRVVASGRWRRLVWAAGLAPVFAAVWTANAVGRGLDPLLFPRFRQQAIREPVFLLAGPRSGTTYLHRLMSLDTHQFTAFSLFNTLAPNIVAYRLAAVLSALDGRLGGPGAALVTALEARAFKGWDDIHATRFGEAEEDEGLWVLMLQSPGLYNMFPEIDQLPELGWLDRVSEDRRARLAHVYRETVRRHLHADGGTRVFLAKNVLASGRLGIVEQALPDARYVHLVRHPYQTVASMLSMYHAPWATFTPQILKNGPESRQLAQLLLAYVDHLAKRALAAPQRYLTIQYDDLVADPVATVEQVYQHLGLEITDAYRVELVANTRRQRHYRSRHQYSLQEYGLSEAFVWERVGTTMAEFGMRPD